MKILMRVIAERSLWLYEPSVAARISLCATGRAVEYLLSRDSVYRAVWDSHERLLFTNKSRIFVGSYKGVREHIGYCSPVLQTIRLFKKREYVNQTGPETPA